MTIDEHLMTMIEQMHSMLRGLAEQTQVKEFYDIEGIRPFGRTRRFYCQGMGKAQQNLRHEENVG